MTNLSDAEYYKLCQNIHETEDNIKKLEFAKDSYLQFLGTKTHESENENA